jgi:hypothetical protein
VTSPPELLKALTPNIAATEAVIINRDLRKKVLRIVSSTSNKDLHEHPSPPGKLQKHSEFRGFRNPTTVPGSRMDHV